MNRDVMTDEVWCGETADVCYDKTYWCDEKEIKRYKYMNSELVQR